MVNGVLEHLLEVGLLLSTTRCVKIDSVAEAVEVWILFRELRSSRSSSGCCMVTLIVDLYLEDIFDAGICYLFGVSLTFFISDG